MSHSLPIRRLAFGCSAIALAAALAAPVSAQSFQGSATVVFGSANVVQGQTTTNVNVSTPSAVIDWTPSDTAISNGTPINWQPAGTQANFIGQSPDFAVLNRIVPADASRPITFNGTVVSRYIQGQVGFTGGTVFFYSPGGIVIGANAVFDIGNLGLTTAPPVVDGNGNWYTNNTVQFGQANSTSAIRTQPGAQINATAQDSYIAAFAPQIQHSGSINANGQAALVAGEAGTITFSPDGLFNIEITAGSESGINIGFQGRITGPASSGIGDNHRIYLVAVPKNSAISVAIAGGASLGFDVAGAADVQGNSIILSAGQGLDRGNFDTSQAVPGGRIDLSIFSQGPTNFTSNLAAAATDTITASIIGEVNFASDAIFYANQGTFFLVGSEPGFAAGIVNVGGSLTFSDVNYEFGTTEFPTTLFQIRDGSASIDGDLTVSSVSHIDRDSDGFAQGGRVLFNLTNSTLSVGGNLVLDASATSDGAPEAPGAVGGLASAYLTESSSAVVAGVTRILSNGIAGLSIGTSGQGADGTGGTAGLNLDAGSMLTTRELNISADGVGGRDIGGGGGSGAGGTAAINVSGANSVLTVQNPNVTGVLAFGELDMLSAEAIGGATSFAGGVGGTAQGGNATIVVTDGGRLALPTQANATATILARAFGGNASGDDSTGGDASGGFASIALNAATIVGEGIILSSFAQGGGDPDQIASGVVNGGNAIGGIRNVSLANGAVFTGSIVGGGPGGVGGSGSASGRGGDGSGGSANTHVDASTLNVSNRGFLTFAQNSGGGGAEGGSASEGVASTIITAGSVVNLAAGAIFGISATGFANGQGGPVSSIGGNASAGFAVLDVFDSTIQGNGTIRIAALGDAGTGAVTGGVGQGGSALVNLTGSTINVASLTIDATGNGTSYVPGSGFVSGVTTGSGIGGQASLSLSNDSTLGAGSIEINANGEGGRIDAEGVGNMTSGDAIGGGAVLSIADSSLDTGTLGMAANGSGGTFGYVGAGVTSGRSGAGTGGATSVTLSNGTLSAGEIELDAVGDGGDVFIGQGTEFIGGDGAGGIASIFASSGMNTIATSFLSIGSDGGGGTIEAAGGAGGSGTAGQSRIDVGSGASLAIDALGGEVSFSSEGFGGGVTFFDGQSTLYTGAGGSAVGGVETIRTDGGALTITGDIDFEGDDEGGAGAVGGNALVGASTIEAYGGSIAITGKVELSRSATGGEGGTGGNAVGSQGDSETNSFITAQEGGAISIDGVTTIETVISGGNSLTGGTGGAAVGGRAQSYAVGSGSAITYNSNLTIEARSIGGQGATGGAASSSRSYLQAAEGGTTVVNGDAIVRVDAEAGSYLGGTATGGAATAGHAFVFATGGDARMTITGDATISANATGSTGARDAQGNGGPGGAAVAGIAGVAAGGGSGNTISIGGFVGIDATARGGLGLSVSGGNATGGTGYLSATASGSTITIGQGASLITDAYAGNVDSFADLGAPAGTRGGDALGGAAIVNVGATDASVSVGGDLYLSPFAYGGDVSNSVGDGGDATAGLAAIFSSDGKVSVGGDFDADPIAEGGFGDSGGDALSSSGQSAVRLIAQNSAVTIAGATRLSIEATGGDGRNGGAGGSATAGGALIVADSSANGPSIVRFADISIDTAATGGAGGDGIGTAGGAGGGATANLVQAIGRPGNGTLVVTGSTQLLTTMLGGTGGSSDTATGGAGGKAEGGYIQFGTISGADVGPANEGSASFADVLVHSYAAGGAGGASGSGIGGKGGDAEAYGGELVAEGSPVTAAAVTITGTGVGGAGGSGATAGAGGYGAAGTAYLYARQRDLRAERGQVTAGAVTLLSVGQGGAGSTMGGSYYASLGGVDLAQSDVTIELLTYQNIGLEPTPPEVFDPGQDVGLTLSDATLTVDTLSMTTPGEFLLDLDNSTIDAGSFTISAGTFVLPETPPAMPGTVTVSDSLSLAATAPGGSIRSYANLVSENATSFSSFDSIVLGTIETGGLFEAESLTGSITIGDIDAGSAVLAAQGDILTGAVMVSGQFTAESSSGSISVGSVDAGDVALRGTDISGARIDASSISAIADGTVHVLGPWSAPSIQVSARDLDIPNAGSLAAGTAGSLQLITVNSAGAFIGDGPAAEDGFRLSNAEFARISGNDIFIGVLDSTTNEVDLTIGTLTIAASQLPGTDGYLEFATGRDEGQQSGRIRVDGALTGGGYSAGQELAFSTASFELNAETGSIALAGNGPGGLGGIVSIDAANIHIAAPSILTSLRANPRYEGVVDDLNAPAATQRPDGVLRAQGLLLYPSDTLYIQNTGTAANPAGFYTTLEESDIEPPGFENQQAPDVDVIINGRFATATGDISGQEVAAAIAENAESLEGFAAVSQINGCAFSGESCGSQSPDEEGPGLAPLQSEIELLTGQNLEEEPFDLDEASEEEEEEAEEAASAPIEPPVMLINTRPLNPPLDIVDPVSGSGNPASLSPELGAPGPGDDQ